MLNKIKIRQKKDPHTLRCATSDATRETVDSSSNSWMQVWNAEHDTRRARIDSTKRTRFNEIQSQPRPFPLKLGICVKQLRER